MTIEDVKETLRQAEEQLAEYQRLADLASFAASIRVQSQPVRTASYPLGIVLDKKAVHALVG